MHLLNISLLSDDNGKYLSSSMLSALALVDFHSFFDAGVSCLDSNAPGVSLSFFLEKRLIVGELLFIIAWYAADHLLFRITILIYTSDNIPSRENYFLLVI